MIIPEAELANYITQIPENVHHNFKNKIGDKFWGLEVKFFAGFRDSGNSRLAYYICKCQCGNFCLLSTGNIGPSRGTKSCGCGKAKINAVSPEDVAFRISRLESETPYKVVDPFEGKYDSKWLLNCELHGNFKSRWGNVVFEGTRCPSCACLSRGFNQMIPGYFYINILEDSRGDKVAIKYGVTNSSPSKRLNWLSFGTTYTIKTVFSRKFKLGSHALELEAQFRKNFGTRFLSKEQLLVGFTETTDPSNLNKCIAHAESYEPTEMTSSSHI